MKTIIIVLLISGSLIFGISKINPNTSKTNDISTMGDITQFHLVQPQAKDIIPLFGLDKDQWNGGDFHFVDINDVSFNHVYEVKIEKENKWLSNEFERTKKVKNFTSSITKILSDAAKAKVGRSNSSIYIPIAHELNRLSQSYLDTKILLVYSDLIENTNQMSFYDSTKLSLVKKNPQLITKYFSSLVPLRNLNGIKVYLIYQPSNSVEDGQYRIMSEYYKNLLESKGATVDIVANL